MNFIKMWFRKTPNHLPVSEGKFIPGSIDLMNEFGKNGIFVRIYYPTSLDGKIEDYSNKWPIWSPNDKYLDGFARLVRIWPALIKIIMWFYSGSIYIPTVNGGKPKTDTKLKCIIMSHGLCASRFLSSIICYNFASCGFLVAIIEHRDRSASFTYYYPTEKSLHEDNKTPIYFKSIPFGNKDHYDKRNEQIKFRSEECQKVLNFLEDVNNGKPVKNILDPLIEDNQFDLKLLKNKIDVSNVCIMGHSFGAATALYTLAHDNRFKVGIILDPWMFPIKNEQEVFENITQPLIFVNTQTFHIVANVNSMERLYSSNQEQNVERKREMYTILHTTHEHQCDTPAAMGFWLNWFMKKLPLNLATRINNSLILKFLNKHLGCPEDIKAIDEILLKEKKNYIEGLTTPWF